MAAGTPRQAWVCLEMLDDPITPYHKEFYLPTGLDTLTVAIGQYIGAQAWDPMPTGYKPTYQPLFWENWSVEDKLIFMGLCDAVTYIAPPSPPNELEWAVRRGWYYTRVQNRTKAPVYLYIHENYRGYYIYLYLNTPEMPKFNFELPSGEPESVDFNDNISSVAVKSPDGYKYLVRLWEHQNYKGKAFITMTDIQDLHDFGWNDMVSSVEIERLGD